MTTNLFAACRTDGALSVKRVRVTRDVQRALAAMFAQQDEEFFKGVTDEVPFDGDWKPDANELLSLDAPDEAAVITDALQANVTSITELGGQPTEGVRALFTGGENESPPSGLHRPTNPFQEIRPASGRQLDRVQRGAPSPDPCAIRHLL
jgi:hypothetical protein